MTPPAIAPARLRPRAGDVAEFGLLWKLLDSSPPHDESTFVDATTVTNEVANDQFDSLSMLEYEGEDHHSQMCTHESDTMTAY
jgi:hypothetical protein